MPQERDLSMHQCLGNQGEEEIDALSQGAGRARTAGSMPLVTCSIAHRASQVICFAKTLDLASFMKGHRIEAEDKASVSL